MDRRQKWMARMEVGVGGSDKEIPVDVKICCIFHTSIERLPLSRSQLCSVLFTLAQQFAANIEGMFAL